MSWEQNVFSSNVQTVAYDSEAGEMVVTFNSGRVYAYEGVPEEVANDLSKTASVGQMLNSEIKGVYNFRRIR